MPTRIIALVPGALQPVNLTEAKTHLRVDGTDEDALIEVYIMVATQAAADRLQRTLVPTRYRLTVDVFPAALVLIMPPVATVESVKYLDATGTQQTLDPQDYLLDSVSEPGYLVPAVGRAWPATQDRINAIEVEYTAGYAAGLVPTPVKQWILLALGDLYEQRARSADKPEVPRNFADGLLDAYRIWGV